MEEEVRGVEKERNGEMKEEAKEGRREEGKKEEESVQKKFLIEFHACSSYTHHNELSDYILTHQENHVLKNVQLPNLYLSFFSINQEFLLCRYHPLLRDGYNFPR